MGYKYPYIPKPYYPATMFACKMIREDGFFNKAISAASRYYSVDPDELEKHVRARQGAGQKAKSATKGRKYSWFAVQAIIERTGVFSKACRATNATNAVKQVLKGRVHWNSDWGYEIEGLVQTDSKDEAEETIRKWRSGELVPYDECDYSTADITRMLLSYGGCR